jgi:hypothetical protein
MRSLIGAAVASAALLAWGCGTDGTVSTSSSGSGGAGGAPSACPACITDGDCRAGSRCAQFAGDAYCAPSCSATVACSADRACTPVTGAEGAQIQVCVPRTDVCGGDPVSGSSSSSSTSGGADGGAVCGSLHAPDSPACCATCDPGQSCQANGCYAGWWCNADTCKCQQPPEDATSCGPDTSSSSSSSTSSSGSDAGTTDGGSITSIHGGTLDTLSFAIVGDTRPPANNDTAGYPKAVIKKIWKDLEDTVPRPAFAVTTGDYVFAKTSGHQAAPQLDLYLAARAGFSNGVFYTLGNHECTGAVASNCGPGSANGMTNNYKAFLAKLIDPLGLTEPYYSVTVKATDQSWTAKFVFVAANAWSSAQSTWLTKELGKPTTYTFIMRHEAKSVTDAPGVTPSNKIIAKHPYTLLIVGHTHSYALHQSVRTVVVGNGGAPLTGNVNYGYVIARMRDDGAIVFREHDYSTLAVKDTFAVKPDGTFTQ